MRDQRNQTLVLTKYKKWLRLYGAESHFRVQSTAQQRLQQEMSRMWVRKSLRTSKTDHICKIPWLSKKCPFLNPCLGRNVVYSFPTKKKKIQYNFKQVKIEFCGIRLDSFNSYYLQNKTKKYKQNLKPAVGSTPLKRSQKFFKHNEFKKVLQPAIKTPQ